MLDIFFYTKQNAFIYRCINILSIITTTMTIISFSYFALIDVKYGLVFGFLTIFVSTFLLIAAQVNLYGYKNFDLKKHKRIQDNYFKNGYNPSIDIFLPICGEDLKILNNTWEGVSKIDYDNYNVYVLDDRASEDAKALAEAYKFNYLSRPNRGEMKKAGNLKFGYENTNSEFIVVFDADFRPKPEFIKHLLPYTADEKVGIVQSPQAFDHDHNLHKKSMLQYGAVTIQTFFYKIVQVSRAYFKGAICVGSNAIYRRSALQKAGGFYQIEHSEDVWTGYNLVQNGYLIKYIPLILALGECPDNPYSFFKQQTRWCQGSVTLATSKMFWQAKVSWLSKMCYISGFMFFLSSLARFIIPFGGMYALYFYSHQFIDTIPLPFIFGLISVLIILPTYVYPNARLGTILAYNLSMWAYSFAIVKNFVFRKKERWVATGGGAKQKDNSYNIMVSSVGIYTFVHFILLIFVLLSVSNPFNLIALSIIFWLVLNQMNQFLATGYLIYKMYN
ncbi:MAG: cellulose synthase catalytic subunit [Patescibacteria group bacterium]